MEIQSAAAAAIGYELPATAAVLKIIWSLDIDEVYSPDSRPQSAIISNYSPCIHD